VMVRSAIGGAEPRPRPPSRAQVCAATDRAADEIAARYPDAPRESLEDMEEYACTHDPAMAPIGEPKPVSVTPGCHMLSGSDRRTPKPVSATEPARPVPFFAERSGDLPPSGKPRVGGVQLPAGSRCGPFWSTDGAVADSVALARRLAGVFPSTGLWPVLWTWPEEAPDAYVNGGPGLARVDSLDAETILRRAWREFDSEGPFPGLADAEPAPDRLDVEPFGDLLDASALDERPPGGRVLMLVPVNRPADVLAVLRPQNTVYFSDDELTAVLRSWEERFGAVVTSISPGSVDLIVGAPPQDDDQVNSVATEHAVLAPDAWDEDTLRMLLRSDQRDPGTTSVHYWSLGWPD